MDVRDEPLETFRQRYGDIFLTRDAGELLARDDVDAVFVTSPDYCHEAQAVAALEAGKHVYLEKPMAITTAGCDRILGAARASGKRLYLGHNMRHMDFTQKMKALIDAGAIGRPMVAWCRHFVGYGCDAYFKDWHAERRYSTGLLLQKGAHDIDIIHWLCGGYSQRVVGLGGLTLYDQITDRRREDDPPDASWHLSNWPPLSQTRLNPVIDVEDVSHMAMRLDNGVHATYLQCHYAPDGWRNYTIIGTEGRIENTSERIVRLWDKRTHCNPDGDAHYVMPVREGGHGGSDERIALEFVRFCREGGPIQTSPVAARYSVAAGCAATESIRADGQPRDVPRLPEDLQQYFDRDNQGA
jgi:predicted dehydrogenase